MVQRRTHIRFVIGKRLRHNAQSGDVQPVDRLTCIREPGWDGLRWSVQEVGNLPERGRPMGFGPRIKCIIICNPRECIGEAGLADN